MIGGGLAGLCQYRHAQKAIKLSLYIAYKVSGYRQQGKTYTAIATKLATDKITKFAHALYI